MDGRRNRSEGGVHPLTQLCRAGAMAGGVPGDDAPGKACVRECSALRFKWMAGGNTRWNSNKAWPPFTCAVVRGKQQAGTPRQRACSISPFWPWLAWSAGCQYWAWTELGMLRTMRLSMSRRVLQLLPREAETWRAFWRHRIVACEASQQEPVFHTGRWPRQLRRGDRPDMPPGSNRQNTNGWRQEYVGALFGRQLDQRYIGTPMIRVAEDRFGGKRRDARLTAFPRPNAMMLHAHGKTWRTTR